MNYLGKYTNTLRQKYNQTSIINRDLLYQN